MALKVKPKRKKLILCDPAVCNHCEYICEGDFICDKKAEPVVVISAWEPTEDYLWCEKRRGKDG